jgi:hypothetical protein
MKIIKTIIWFGFGFTVSFILLFFGFWFVHLDYTIMFREWEYRMTCLLLSLWLGYSTGSYYLMIYSKYGDKK